MLASLFMLHCLYISMLLFMYYIMLPMTMDSYLAALLRYILVSSYLSSLRLHYIMFHFTPNLLHIMYVLHLNLHLMSSCFHSFHYPIYIHYYPHSYLSYSTLMFGSGLSNYLDFSLYYMLVMSYLLLLRYLLHLHYSYSSLHLLPYSLVM